MFLMFYPPTLTFSFHCYNRGLIDDGQDTFHIVPVTENEVGCAK